MEGLDITEPSWFCIRSQPKHEHIVAAHLSQIPTVQVFCPRLRMKRATRVGAKWFTEAMFPGYLFACFDFHSNHKQVRYAPGVSGILRFGDKYAVIDNAIIESLRHHTNEQQIAVVEPGVTVGDTVQVVEGSLRGLEAIVTRVLPGKERLHILMTFLGRQIEAEVPAVGVLAPSAHPLVQDRRAQKKQDKISS